MPAKSSCKKPQKRKIRESKKEREARRWAAIDEAPSKKNGKDR